MRLHRPAEKVSLHLVTAALTEKVDLFAGLHAFGEDIHAQALGHGNHRFDDGRVVGAARHVTDEGAVNLDAVDGKMLEIGQGRVPRTEVIDGQGHTAVLELPEQGDVAVGGLHEDAFRELEMICAETTRVQGERKEGRTNTTA